jgi:hypothetical protein
MLFGDNGKVFYDQFDQAAENAIKTAELFKLMVSDFKNRNEILSQIREAEHRGDFITHETMTRLDKSFITPLDREDIHHLITETDDVVDALDAAAQRMILYRVEKPNEDMIKQAETAVQITRKLADAIKLIRNMKRPDELNAILIEIHTLENRGDEHNHAALARLFESNDAMEVLRWKELYELVESAIDACETVAHTIRSIMVKNA